MPCNSDYMNASSLEVSASRAACLLGELDGVPFTKGWWDGYHPSVYNHCSRELADQLVSKLCDRLQHVDVSKCSLEMQIWWRDHQKADAERLRKEAEQRAKDDQKREALAKLSDDDKAALGLVQP